MLKMLFDTLLTKKSKAFELMTVIEAVGTCMISTRDLDWLRSIVFIKENLARFSELVSPDIRSHELSLLFFKFIFILILSINAENINYREGHLSQGCSLSFCPSTKLL